MSSFIGNFFLSCLVAVVADQCGVLDAFDGAQFIHEACFVVLDFYFIDQFRLAVCDALGFYDDFAETVFDDFGRLQFRILILQLQHQNVGGRRIDLSCQNEQDDRDECRSEESQRIQASSQDDADADRPEKEDQVKRLLDGGTEADDRKGTDHPQGKDYVGSYSQDDESRQDRQQHQRSVEGFRIHDAGIGFFIDEEDEQADEERR